jgi:CRISPR-associated endonuclease/helicase Cas3
LRVRRVKTEHLSTALAPVDREKILESVRAFLIDEPDRDWVLVATSCVEAGVNLSFGTAFRERCRAASLVQIGGRVNRHSERDGGVVLDFAVTDPVLTAHPDFKHTREVVEELFRKDMWSKPLTELMTYALEQEFKRHSGEDQIKELLGKEQVGAYPEVARLTRLINSDTRLVVVDPGLIATLRRGIPVNRHDLLIHSVQLWCTKIKKLALSPIGRDEELFAWEYEYDPEFLGIMDGILKQIQVDADGFAII